MSSTTLSPMDWRMICYAGRVLLLLLPMAASTSRVPDFNNVRPSPKTWWAKQITPYLYTAGRITDVQMKQAADAGFRSIISLLTFSTNSSVGEEVSFSTNLARQIAEDVVGVHYDVILEVSESYARVETIRKLTEAIFQAPRPILLHSASSYTATFAALNFVLNQTQFDLDFEPKLDSAGFYETAALHGYLFNITVEKNVVAEISGEDCVVHPPSMPYSLIAWRANNMWVLKPVHDNIYIAGQLKANYLNNAKGTGYDVIINTRAGDMTDGEPSQEEVTLLNIEDNTGTYDEGGRQSLDRLLDTRMDPERSNDYPGFGSEFNFQSRNALEFGDDVGYSETCERDEVASRLEMTYIHTPMDFQFSRAVWDNNRDMWLQAAETGSAVIIHCRVGYRAAVGALLTAGYKNGLDSEWAILRARQMGYHFEGDGYEDVRELFRDVLDN